tara:strand:- start:739 stop:1410 length:672 start_codon:yes stop_codon:yes gene_type:complete
MKRAHTLTAACLSALTITQASASITLSASDDNFVYSSSSSTNYNSESTQIYVKNASTDRIGFIKFDLSSVIASLNTSEDATLDLTFKNASSAGSGDTANFTISALTNTGASNTNWTEGSVTYSTRPDGTFTSVGTYSWSYNASNVPVSITFSDIADYIQTDNTITFRIFGTQTDTSNNFYWHSSEAETAAYQPSLTVIPEPSAAAILLSLAVLGIVGSRRSHK